jgi:hypothetical protein
LRFAQAGNLRLNHPLRGVGPLSAPARHIAETAPALAWERVVAACIENGVDFLLLTPQTMAGASLIDDRRTLLAGFRRLADSGIPVFWALAARETSDVLSGDLLPDNVTVLSEDRNSATLTSDGRLLAEITFGGASPGTKNDRPDVLILPGDQPLRIMIPAEPDAFERLPAAEARGSDAGRSPENTGYDYVACWGSTRLQSRKVGETLFAEPGTPQGRSVDEPGSGGICIVEWQTGRIADIVRVPTAPVRWEQFLLVVTPETSRAELIERLQFLLLEREPAIGESLWLVHWRVAGSGPGIELLRDADTRREVEDAVESAFGDGERLTRVHRWEVHPRGAAATDSVSTMLQEWFPEHAEATWPSVKLEVEAVLNRTNTAAFADGLPQLRAATAREDAEQLVAGWLASPARDAG